MAGRTIVLGAGFGGLAAATELRAQLGPDHEILLIDRRSFYLMGLRKLWALAGVATLAPGRRYLNRLGERGIRFVRGNVRSIDPESLAVETGENTYEADFIIIALGAVPRADQVPGLLKHGANLYDPDAIQQLSQQVQAMEMGRILVAVLGLPYKCPPAPYEALMLLHHRFTELGHEGVRLAFTTCQPALFAQAGPEAGERMADALRRRGITYRLDARVEAVEAGKLVLEKGSVSFDLLLGIPPHAAPPVLVESGLTDHHGWISVDPHTLETPWPGVYAIGDNTHIPVVGDQAVPKAGVFAEGQGLRVARAIAAAVKGAEPPPPYRAIGACYVEMGGGEAMLMEADFYAEPEPRLQLGEVSAAHTGAKQAFEQERLERWFGA